MNQPQMNQPPQPPVTSNSNPQWQKVCAFLRNECGDDVFNSWFARLTFVAIDNGKVQFHVSSDFVRDWIISHYQDRLLTSWQMVESSVQEIVVDVVSHAVGETDNGVGNGAGTPGVDSSADDDLGSSLRLDTRFTFGNFVVGKSNELAFAAAQRVADLATPHASYNPLFLYGGVGLGKTHLMHAIAWHIKSQHKKNVLYMTAEKFMYQFILALRYKSALDFKKKFRSVDVLMVDDFQFISKAEATQEEFFHTFNSLVDDNRQIVISADKSPDSLEGVEERLRSRLGAGMVAYIDPASYELRLGILESKVSQMTTPIPRKVLEFIARRITSNVRVLEGALNRLVAYASLVNKPICEDVAYEALQDLLLDSAKRVSVESIQKMVCQHYNVKLSEMSSPRRAREVVRPRQIAMFLAKEMTTRSLPDIGRRFGKRDHTTVLHAIRKVEDLSRQDPSIREDIMILRRRLGG
ncbi:MAG: chromosomal replication initiator protein DnaA [Alphaproteobacteria bacterium GM202ARS2]|nr:chromosomal replication initiator protein DnaA [Alphaproteobacteria bacterium GM202ARS2]